MNLRLRLLSTSKMMMIIKKKEGQVRGREWIDFNFNFIPTSLIHSIHFQHPRVLNSTFDLNQGPSPPSDPVTLFFSLLWICSQTVSRAIHKRSSVRLRSSSHHIHQRWYPSWRMNRSRNGERSKFSGFLNTSGTFAMPGEHAHLEHPSALHSLGSRTRSGATLVRC